MHLFQTNNRTQTWCLVSETSSWNHVENTPGHEKLSRTCLAYLWHFGCLTVCICVCLWSQSNTNAPSTTRCEGSAPFDLRQHKEKERPQNKGLQKVRRSIPSPPSQTTVWHLHHNEHRALVLLSKSLRLLEGILVWGHLKERIRRRRCPKIGCLFILK